MGKSSKTDEKVNTVIDRVSAGIPLAQVLRDLGIGHTTWYEWVKADDALAERIARAREAGADMIAADALQIADTPPPTTDKGGTDAGFVSWQKNRIWTRLQLLAKWDPKRYGERVTHAGDTDAPLTIQTIERKIIG